jgi:hypothetical protein
VYLLPSVISGMTFCNLFTPYDVRKGILRNLSAFDVAKLDIVMGNILDPSERKLYLNPTRDLIWDTKEMNDLIECGMKLLLIGPDIHTLTRRLQNPQSYLRSCHYKRKLRVYLIGYFTINGVTSDALDRMLAFTITRVPSQCRIFRDKMQLRRMKGQISGNGVRADAAFIMSFGLSTQIGTNKSPCWHKVDDIPDCTIDLRVYIPDLQSRLREEVRLPWRESLRLSKYVLRRSWKISSLIMVLCMHRESYTLEDFLYAMQKERSWFTLSVLA